MKKDVLVVDDDPALLFHVRKIFEAEGLNVRTVESGEACIEELEKGFYGLILMDIMMPRMDGWDTIQSIIKHGYTDKNIICMLTAKEEPDERLDEFKEHVLDYIRKPFDNKILISLVKRYLSLL